MAIRYDKKLNTEINRIIRNFNQKISRLEKQERELLPTKITKKELKSSVTTRNELYRKLKELQRFSKRGAEDIITTRGGVKITKYELSNLKRRTATVRRNITREINRMAINKPKIFGKEQASTFSEMGDTEYLNLLARRKVANKNIDKLTKDEFERFLTFIDKSAKKQAYMNNIFKENYFKMLTDMAYYFNYDNDKLNKLKDKLMDLSPNNFLRLFKEDKAIRAILDYYPVITNTFNAIDPDDIKEDVTNLYDALIDNIDEIIEDYA